MATIKIYAESHMICQKEIKKTKEVDLLSLEVSNDGETIDLWVENIDNGDSLLSLSLKEDNIKYLASFLNTYLEEKQ